MAIIGGIAAIIWAMRDRFVSVAISREPQPPSFRVHEKAGEISPPSARPESKPASTTKSEPAVPEASDSSDRSRVTEVTGIGPVFAGRLAEAGIKNLAELAAARPEKVAAAAQVALSRATDWVEAARRMR